MEEHYISRKLYSKKQVKSVEKKIKLLGVSTKLNTYMFLNIRLIWSMLIFFILLYFNKLGYIFGPVVAIII